MKRQMLRILLVLILSVGLAASASAITYIYTSVPGDTSPYAGIDYSISLTGGEIDNTWDCTFSIETPSIVPATSPYSVGWFQIKFNGGNFSPGMSATAELNSTPAGPNGTWNVLNNTNVLEFGNETFPTNNRAGYYIDANIGNYTSVMPNLFLASHTYSWDFDVNMLSVSDPFTISTTLPLQVGFYGGLLGPNGSHIQVARLSETAAAVPEPAMTYMMILLIGPVTAIIAGLRKKMKKS